MKNSFDRRDEYEKDVFASESSLFSDRTDWDDFESGDQEELDGYDELDMDYYGNEEYEEDE